MSNILTAVKADQPRQLQMGLFGHAPNIYRIEGPPVYNSTVNIVTFNQICLTENHECYLMNIITVLLS